MLLTLFILLPGQVAGHILQEQIDCLDIPQMCLLWHSTTQIVCSMTSIVGNDTKLQLIALFSQGTHLLQATMARKFRSSGDNNVGTEWALNYQLHPHLRMTFHISASTPYPRSVFFHWNSEAMPRLPSD